MVKVISSTKAWQYRFPGHPESPERVRKTYEYLVKKGYDIVQATPCSQEDILRVHTKELLDEVKNGGFFDADTPVIKNIYDYAILSAGAAIQAAKFALEGENAFSLMRPPGHHAYSDSLGGFCYFNNIAIAVKYLLSLPPLKGGATTLTSQPKVAILDIDCHHGNGTEDIFRGEKNVIFVSIHQSPLYPGTGLKSFQNCLNYPVPPGTDEDGYCEVLKDALEEIKKFKPSIIAISAGFDTYKDDPLTNLNLTKESYRKIAEIIRSLKLPLFAVLEGGYSPDLPECIYNFLSVL